MVTLILCLLMPFTYATGIDYTTAQSPLLCAWDKAHLTYKAPDPSITCPHDAVQNTIEMREVDYMFYRKNVYAYETSAFLCKRIRHIVKIRPWAIPYRNTRIETEEDEIISYSECQNMRARNTCKHGDLAKFGNVLRTDNKVTAQEMDR